MSKFNIYQEITNRIINQLEQGEIPWQKPWTGSINGAFNRITKKPYSMLNQMLLIHDGEYATYKQWTNLGGKIKKGSKAEMVVFWKLLQVSEVIEGEEYKKIIPLLKYINVFHISQVEGVEPLNKDELTEHEPIEMGESIISEYIDREGLEIKMDSLSNKAYYSPSYDYIRVPSREQYKNINEFYSTTFHEMVHSTGHISRLKRFDVLTNIAPFGSEDYSKEELIAELGSAFLMNYAGIETPKTFKNSSAYIQSWLRVLKNDNKFIVSASSKSEKAVKYILGIKEDNNEINDIAS